jgi:tetratricopeptide (TPR) repeat protein
MNGKTLIRILLAALIVLLVSSCKEEEDPLLRDMVELESEGYAGQEISDERLAEIKSGIQRYREIVARKVEAAEQLGIYYKLLANAYMERKMWALALSSIQNAIDIYPENPILFYLAAVSAARFGKSKTAAAERMQLLRSAEQFYLRSIDLDASYSEALYGVAVLYVFELEEPRKAEPYLMRLLNKEEENYDAMFLLARVYVETERIDAAVRIYDDIIAGTEAVRLRSEAQRNKELLTGGGS